MRCGAYFNLVSHKYSTLCRNRSNEQRTARPHYSPIPPERAGGKLPRLPAQSIKGYKGGRIRRTAIIPKEEDEQLAFVQWCHAHGIICHHSGNEIGGSTSAMKARAVKMKKLGTSKGFPDLLIFIPIYGNTDEPDAYQPVAIEMKRQKGSTTSPEQNGWLKVLEMAGIPGAVCKGCTAAVEYVEGIIKEIEGEYNA